MGVVQEKSQGQGYEGMAYPDYLWDARQMPDPEQKPSQRQDASRHGLLSLPAEIRNLIYDYLLLSPEFLPTISPPILAVNVLRTCRQIYEEAIQVLYSWNQWRIEFQSGSKKYYEYFLSRLSVANAKRMHHLEIVLWGDYFGDIPLHWEKRGDTMFVVGTGIDLKHLVHAPRLLVCIDFYNSDMELESGPNTWLWELFTLSFIGRPFQHKLVFDTFRKRARDSLDALYGVGRYRSCSDSLWFRRQRLEDESMAAHKDEVMEEVVESHPEPE